MNNSIEKAREAELKKQFQELQQLVDAFFNRDTPTRARAAFSTHREETLLRIPEMGDVLRQFPVYGAVAFLGKFQFAECEEVASLAKGYSEELLKTLRQKKAVQLADSARAAWDFLLKDYKDELCLILALCYMATKNTKITKALAA